MALPIYIIYNINEILLYMSIIMSETELHIVIRIKINIIFEIHMTMDNMTADWQQIIDEFS